MAAKYLDQLTTMIAGATQNRYSKAELTCKHFFSGAALYVNGRICLSLTPVGFAVKPPERDRVSLLTKDRADPLRYFDKSPIKKDYVVLREFIVADTRALRRWIRKSIEYVLDNADQSVQSD